MTATRAATQLAALTAAFEAAERRLRLVADRLSDTQFLTRRDPTRWSPADCVAHLNATSRAFVPLMQAAVEAAADLPPLEDRALRRDPVGWLVGLGAGPMPALGRWRFGKVRTPAAFEVEGVHDRTALLSAFSELQAAQLEVVRQSAGLQVDRVQLTSPVDARVRYSLWSLLHISVRHQERHITQAAEVWA